MELLSEMMNLIEDGTKIIMLARHPCGVFNSREKIREVDPNSKGNSTRAAIVDEMTQYCQEGLRDIAFIQELVKTHQENLSSRILLVRYEVGIKL